ncbi:NADH-quinone oxidoreductase subunit NuoE [bacterium]|nr:NADH-quinone oxidoreductase subunit NuoE [bacterium]MBU1752532.1 NADH-quinone oxidoreductase subunit NuoE [bacterium]
MSECKCTCNQDTEIEVFLPEQLAQIDAIVAKYGAKPNYLIPILKETQETFGYLPAQLQRYIAVGINVPASHIFGVVTFYAFFNTVPRGKHLIKVCTGTACYVKGAMELIVKIESELGIKVGETTEDKKFTLEAVRCIGACGLAPAVLVGEDTHGMVTPGKIMDILRRYE